MLNNTGQMYHNTGYRATEKRCDNYATEFLLYRLSRVIEKEKCSGGKRGVSGVSNVLLVNNTNGFNQF